MKNIIHGKNFIISFLCITIIFLAIGFIALSVKENKLKNNSSNYKVIFTNLEKVSSIKGDDIEPVGKGNIKYNGHEIDMEFELNNVHDKVTYVATIKNTGDIPAKIVDIIESPNYHQTSFSSMISPIKIELSNINSKILEPMDSIELKINVIYPLSKEKSGKKKFTYKIGLITESV